MSLAEPLLKTTTATPENETDSLLADLNAEQLTAVTHDKGPLLIVAGAGTGKTTVITKRVAWLITTGRAKPEEVLALTFTEKAAAEMEERIDRLLPLGYVDLWVSTFHAFCQRILQEHALDIGLPNEFRLLNETDAYLLVRKNFERFALDYYRPLGNPTKFIHALLKHFSRAKDEAVRPEEYLEYAKNRALDNDSSADDAEEKTRLNELANAYHTYQRILLENDCLDLGDLLSYTLELFKKRPAILAKYREQFRHVIVDEFQDTNWAQYELLKMLVGREGNIMVVGDDDQSIYKFRGASVANILQFKTDFPASGQVVLTRNYRSKQRILDAAYEFIKRNDPNRLEAKLRRDGHTTISKRLVAEREGEGGTTHLHFAKADDEAAGIVERIIARKEADPEAAWSDVCILVRANSGAEHVSRELERRDVPYQFLALKGLYTKPVILDCLAYFALLDNYHESAALYRLFCSPAYKIAVADLVTLSHEAYKKAESLYEVVRRHATLPDLKEETRATIERLLADVTRHAQLARDKHVTEVLVKFVYESGYLKTLTEEDTQEHRESLHHLRQFMDRLKRFEELHEAPLLRHFMEEFALERDSGEEGGLKFDVDTGPDMVRIMTVHAAKGLEFPVVFVAGMVDKRFPTVARGGDITLPDALTKETAPEGDAHLEEERRLFYVAMTRARDELYLTSAEDYGGKTKKKISRFLDELGFSKPELAPSAVTLEPKIAAREEDAAPHLLPLPPYVSYTQLAAYDKCPLQYKFAHVLKLPVFGKPALSFGKTMHHTLEKFLQRVAEKKNAGQSSLFGDVSSDEAATLPSFDDLVAIYDDSWEDDWYENKVRKEEYRAKGKALLKLFYDDVVAHPPEPMFLEKEFSLKLGSHRIKGKIDRIDDLGDGTVEIIDYKTGKAKDDEKLRPEDKRQLTLYQLAVSQSFGLKPARLTYYYLEDGKRVSFLGSEKDVASFEEDTLEKINGMAAGDYAPKPGMHCGFCDFAGICEFRSG